MSVQCQLPLVMRENPFDDNKKRKLTWILYTAFLFYAREDEAIKSSWSIKYNAYIYTDS